jgi:AcrR family transcriptional regulator
MLRLFALKRERWTKRIMPDRVHNTLNRPLRHARVVSAAEWLFLTVGYRAVTLDAIARAADVPFDRLIETFPDKDAVFCAASEALVLRLDAAFNDNFKTDLSVEQRICDALLGLHRVMRDQVRASAHHRELYEASVVVAGKVFSPFHDTVKNRIAELLSENGFAAEDAARLSHIVFAAFRGLANEQRSYKEIESDARHMVSALINATPLLKAA